jgi:hypothetical protein
MSWIGSKTSVAKTVKARTPAPASASVPASVPATSLESPTVVRARGMAPANAIVEHVTAHRCRLRCVVLFDPGATLEFELTLPNRPAMTMHGRVAARTRSGPRFIYDVTLDRMTQKQTDELAHTLAQSHRSGTRLRSSATLKDLPTTDGLTRKQLRLEADFPIQYRTPKEAFKQAKAANISTGGLLLTCGDALVEGMLLELHFTLPSDVLQTYPEETMVLDLRNPLQRKAVPSKLREPFAEMVLYARVVYHEPIGGGAYSYGLSFYGLERRDREEIARYVDAQRHKKLRSQ